MINTIKIAGPTSPLPLHPPNICPYELFSKVGTYALESRYSSIKLDFSFSLVERSSSRNQSNVQLNY